ncbi:hypothetical protein FM106_29840 [Brachybacterium faecium]|nr:hypothetical protein FM106_29840 [Brachybacterium faecium]
MPCQGPQEGPADRSVRGGRVTDVLADTAPACPAGAVRGRRLG